MDHAVLFVDDDPSVLDAVRRTLRREPYAIHGARDAAQALHLLAQQPFAVVVADHGLPGIAGAELLARVRERWPEIVRFMVTGQGTLETALTAINQGQVARFFQKPCDLREIAVAIRDALRQRELMVCARRLLARVRAYQTEMARLERDHPGLTAVPRDEAGAVMLDAVDCDALVAEIARELDAGPPAPAR